MGEPRARRPAQDLPDAPTSAREAWLLFMENTSSSSQRAAQISADLSAAAILASISDGFHLIDASGCFVQFNDAARRMFQANGIDVDSIVGQHIQTVFPDLESNAGGRALLTCLHDRRTLTAESYYAPWDRWYQVRHYPVANGGVASLFQDITAEKRTQALLNEQQERFEFAAEAAQIGYWFCNLPFDKLTWDTITKKHFWLPPDADVDIGLFYQRLHPDDRERTRQAIEASIGGHRRYDIEYRTVSPDGEIKWIHAVGRTAYKDSGEPIRFDGTTRDITELKAAQQALRESNALFETFANSIPALAWMARPDGWIFWYNQRWYEYTGLPAEQLQGWGWEAVHDPQVLPIVKKVWRECLDHGKPAEMVFPLRGADGHYRYFLTRVAPVRDSSGQVVSWFGTNTDVHEQRLAREALDAERRRWAAVFESAPVGLVFTDAAGRIISGNRRAEEIFGIQKMPATLEDIREQWVFFRGDGSRVSHAEMPLARTLREGVTIAEEYLLQRNDGSRLWVEVTSAPILNAEGSIAGAVVALGNVDTRKRAQQALVRNEKLVVVGRMAATISHEINNPLESVTNLLYLIGETTREDATRNYARIAQKELARVSHIVTHTLRFNRQTMQAACEEISEILDSALAIYTGRIQTAGITLERDYQPADPVLCLGTELRQVFANLIGNAFDATRRGGSILIRTRVKSRDRQPGVQVTIADTGHGMDRATLRRLSEPFFTTKGDNGTGLGLWVSRDILKRHNARLNVWSCQTPGRSGSIFTLWFPYSSTPPRPADLAETLASRFV
jgi:PAS domain S-box-containing protein